MRQDEGTGAAAAGHYQYDIAHCDVMDTERLKQYRVKRSEWLHLLDGDQEHALWKQIAVMFWNDAVFRLINESRRLAEEGKYRSASRNGTLASLIDQGYFAIQTLSIRKMLEKGKERKHQVISLRRLLDDVKHNICLITREIYVAHDGLPYDPKLGRDRFLAAPPENGGAGTFPASGPEAWPAAERAHAVFDNLAGVNPGDRSRDDRVHPDIFTRLEFLLSCSRCDHFATLGNKSVAHAADLFSRNQAGIKLGFTFDQIERCHRALYQVTNYIHSRILWGTTVIPFPSPDFNWLDQLDAPWVTTNNVDHLARFWRAHAALVDNWGVGDILSDCRPEDEERL